MKILVVLPDTLEYANLISTLCLQSFHIFNLCLKFIDPTAILKDKYVKVSDFYFYLVNLEFGFGLQRDPLISDTYFIGNLGFQQKKTIYPCGTLLADTTPPT